MTKGVMCMNDLMQQNFNSRILKVCIAVVFCISCMGYSLGMHVNGHIEIMNMIVNKEKRSVLPESLFDVTLMGSNMYSVVYKEKKAIAPEEHSKIEEQLGKGNSPTVRYVDSDDCCIGVMPTGIKLLFDNIDAFCSTNGTDYFAASVNSKMVENGEYAHALLFVVTNTPPTSATLKNSHPVLEKLVSPESHTAHIANTNSIPVGASPEKWF